jgi:hypothetical protein
MIAEAVQVLAGAATAVWAGAAANEQRPGTSLIDRLAVSLLGAAGVMAVLAVPMSRLPVVVDVRADVVAQAPGRVDVHVHATKPTSRAMCDYILTDAYVIDPDGALLAVPRTVPADPRTGNTRPAGLLDLGVWTVTYPQDFKACAVTFYAHHSCAWWLRDTVTQLGPVALTGPCQ